ncbi:U-box domain-containing protein 34-like [Silene latifolia]|uniref:U-box domain-containing protein 34-like n=1 Tax=Silene latifolia TaxID=37657 RepID=UPI003D7818AC
MTTIAVAVNVGGDGRGSGSKRALSWAVDNLLPQASRFVLVHVMPTITHIPTPSGDRVAIKDIDAHGATNYVKDVRERAQQIFLHYTTLHKLPGLEFETMLVENDDVSAALVEYISQSGVKSLVIGSSSSLPFWRKTKTKRVAETVLKSAGSTSDVYVVHKRKVKKRLASSMPSNDVLTDKHTILSETYSSASSLSQTPLYSSFSTDHTSASQTPVYSSFSTDNTSAITPVSSWSELTRSISLSDTHHNACVEDDLDTEKHTSDKKIPLTTKDQTVVKPFLLDNEVHQLRVELDTTKAMYSLARDNLLHAQEEVNILSSECVEEVEKVNAATEREETMRKIANQEKRRHLKAVREVKKAQHLLAKESNERQKAELIALKESEGRQRVVEELISKDKRTRQYTLDEIKEATDCFSESKVIGEGSYGKVYKGFLDHTPVAIKVLQSDAIDKKEEFLKEVKILSQLHHPNIVLLLGVCAEIGCLVYEYMENGSLEQHIFRHNGREPLPWFARFRIAFEIACGLAFLHSNKPTPIVHRDLNPGNILLGKHYVGKISDVGLAALLPETAPDSVTMFGTSLLAGTLYYMDPEYQRTGTIRPKSDLYSFGIILLQLLTGRHPNGLLLVMENGIANKSLGKMLDSSIKDWPLEESEELINIAMECCKLRCRDRPDLEKVVLPSLKRLADIADANMKIEKHSKFAPSYYFCPILYEIMEDPHIAADGFTYERKAIEAWLEKSDESPVTKYKLEHLDLTPNMTLLAGIKEWKSHQSSKDDLNHKQKLKKRIV